MDEEKAVFMADSQVPCGEEALNGMISEPAWKTRPSWYLVATDDKMIPLPAQRFMSKHAGSTVVEVAGQFRCQSIFSRIMTNRHRIVPLPEPAQ